MADNYLENKYAEYQARKTSGTRTGHTTKTLHKTRRVFITGGAEGIGKAIVRAFRGAGHRVAFCDKNETLGKETLPYPYTKGNARFFIKQAQEKTDISDFCITVGGEAIGNIGFVRGTDVERFNAEVGYWISEKYWNQGIVSDALTEAIQYYFAHTEVIRIFATVYEYNPASMRVLEKAGFRKTGIFRKACYKNGQFIDAHHFELVADKKLEENQKE